MDELRSWWEVPAIAFFCEVFREPLNIPQFDIEELEESILLSGTPEGSEILTSLLCNLLKGYFGRRDIGQHNCDNYIRKLLSKRWCERSSYENPMNDIDFRRLNNRLKVEILYELCQWRLLSDDIGDLVKDYDGDTLRVSPVGTDEKGSTYWYFLGTRLYRETTSSTSSSSRRDGTGSQERKKSAVTKKISAVARKRKGARKKFADRETESCDDSSLKDAEEPVAVSQWQVVCSSIDEWQALADSLKHSKVSCERNLYRRLTEEFLITIPRIFDEKERIMRKKLLEMAPKRTSTRLHHKKQEHEEQMKIIEQLELAEKLEREHMEAEQRRVIEEQRKEAAARAREERLRLKEERAQRALLREMKAALMAEGKDIPAELMALDSPPPAVVAAEIDTPAASDTAMVTEHEEDDLETKITKVLLKVRRHKNAWPFLEPVPQSLAPDYYTVISKPMDLSRMEDKLKKKEYGNRQEFEDDFNRMVENCRLYNGPFNEYTVLAKGLQEAFVKAMEKHFAPKKPRVHQVNTHSSADMAAAKVHHFINGHADSAAAVSSKNVAKAINQPGVAVQHLLTVAQAADPLRNSRDTLLNKTADEQASLAAGPSLSPALTSQPAGMSALPCRVSNVKGTVPVLQQQPKPVAVTKQQVLQSPQKVMLFVDPATQQMPKTTMPGPSAIALHHIIPGTAAKSPDVPPSSAGAQWPMRHYVIMPKSSAPTTAPLAGWRTVAPASVVLPHPQPVTAVSGPRQPFSVASAPGHSPRPDTVVLRLVNAAGTAATMVGSIRGLTGDSSSVLKSNIHSSLLSTVRGGAMQSTKVCVTSPSVVSIGGAGTTSASGHPESVTPVVTVGNGMGKLLVPREGWVPSHLNLHSSSRGSSSVIPARALGPVSSPVTDNSLKRTANAADCDVATKVPTLPATSAALAGSSSSLR